MDDKPTDAEITTGAANAGGAGSPDRSRPGRSGGRWAGFFARLLRRKG